MTKAMQPHDVERPETRQAGAVRPRFATPGVLGVLIIALVLISLSVGAVTALSVHSRDQTLDSLSSSAGQMHAAAEEFYRALSDADVAAAGAFLARDQGRATDRVGFETKYETSVSEAQSALATLAAGSEDADNPHSNLLSTLPGRLSEYTVLVETARAYNRQGESVASTYQLLAADAMRAHLLPAAKTLHGSASEQVAAEQSRSEAFPVVEVILVLFVLAVLVAAQLFLWRRTNRVFNIGLVVASVAAVSMLVWITFATLTASNGAGDSKEQGTEVVNALSEARIAALSARSNEAHILVAAKDDHGYAEYQQTFAEDSGKLEGSGNLLDKAKNEADSGDVRDQIDTAKDHAATWLDRHESIREAATSDNQQQGVRLLVDVTGDDFTSVDDSLGAAIDDTRQRFSTDIEEASSALTGVVAGAIGLSVLIAAASAIGVWQRLREYR